MTEIIAMVTSVFSVMGTAITEMLKIDLLVFFIATGVVGVGIATFRKLKKAAR